MNEITALLLAKALDGLSMRASAIAQNIANSGSPSYTPLRVSFEDELRSAASSGADAVRQVEPRYVTAARQGANDEMRLDLEMAGASQTAMRYAALVDVLSRQMGLARLAVGGGQP
jgi:flagellar basal-body rod protein FlgB